MIRCPMILQVIPSIKSLYRRNRRPMSPRKKSSMGLNLPVRRLSTDSIDEVLMSEIFDDLSIPDDDDSNSDMDVVPHTHGIAER